MKKKPKWWNWGDIFSVRSLSDKRPLAALRRQALDHYIQLNQLEAKYDFQAVLALMNSSLFNPQRRNERDYAISVGPIAYPDTESHVATWEQHR